MKLEISSRAELAERSLGEPVAADRRARPAILPTRAQATGDSLSEPVGTRFDGSLRKEPHDSDRIDDQPPPVARRLG